MGYTTLTKPVRQWLAVQYNLKYGALTWPEPICHSDCTANHCLTGLVDIFPSVSQFLSGNPDAEIVTAGRHDWKWADQRNTIELLCLNWTPVKISSPFADTDKLDVELCYLDEKTLKHLVARQDLTAVIRLQCSFGFITPKMRECQLVAVSRAIVHESSSQYYKCVTNVCSHHSWLWLRLFSLLHTTDWHTGTTVWIRSFTRCSSTSTE